MATKYLFKGSGTVAGVSYTKKLRKVDDDDAESEADCTGGGDTEKEYEAGIPDRKITVEVLGSAPAKGTEGGTNISWGDGSSSVLTPSVVTGVKKSGQVGGVIVYTVTVRKKAS